MTFRISNNLIPISEEGFTTHFDWKMHLRLRKWHHLLRTDSTEILMSDRKIKRRKSRDLERMNERVMEVKWYPTEEPSVFGSLDASSQKTSISFLLSSSFSLPFFIAHAIPVTSVYVWERHIFCYIFNFIWTYLTLLKYEDLEKAR